MLILEPLAAFALISLLVIVAQISAWQLRLPAILFLLIAGLLVGPVAGILSPDDLFGDLLFPLVSLAVAVILFEGSMTLKFSELQGIGSSVRNLVTIGALVTWVITSITVHYFIGFDLKLAFLFGAVVVVTGPTVIVPMLRTVRPNLKVANVLRWEGIIIDPLGALLAVLMFSFYISTTGSSALSSMATIFAVMLLVGLVLGLGAGFGLGQLLKRDWIPEHLHSVVTLLLVFLVFVAADSIQHESGLLAVTIFGVAMANQKDVEIEDILGFKETLSILLISGLFVLLAARVDFDTLTSVGYGALVLLFIIMFVARPAAVMLSTLGSSLTMQERLLISWIGPRGIVCAAVAALFALRLEELGIPEAKLFVPLAFLIIIGTVVVQSITAKPVANLLGVRDPAPSGVLFIGAGIVPQTLAAVLEEADLSVTLVDSNYDNVRTARMKGFTTYYGNPASEHADTHLELAGLGKLMAMSGRSDFDVLMGVNFKSVFGAKSIYELPTNAEGVTDKHLISHRFRGQRLFQDDVTYNKIAGWIAKGAEIKSTLLTDEFGLAEYEQRYQASDEDSNHAVYVPLFAVDPNGKLSVFTTESNFQPVDGWRMISLIHPTQKVEDVSKSEV
ncbi:MAG: CPA1 family monovalent cation:H+ antiporter [Candidatus Azotimanducaceae bacterium]|jgi:CPA1 family monovalent cation:H+ antiporter